MRDPGGWLTRITEADIVRNRASGVWPDRMVHELAWARAEATPDAPAIYVEAGPALTYGAAVAEAKQLAAAMVALGLKPGDVVSYQLPNWAEAASINIAVSSLGLVINPIIPIYRGAECQHILNDAGTKLLFIPETIRGFDYRAMIAALKPSLPRLETVIVVRSSEPGPDSYEAFVASGAGQAVAWPKVDPNSVKLMLFTSGTTGRAKGVLHTHNTLGAGALIGGDYWKWGPEDVIFMPSPVTHITGYTMGLEFPFTQGVRSALMLRWNAADGVDYIERVGATMTVGATPFLQELIAEAERRGTGLPSLRMFACGGAAVPPDLIREGHRVFTRCRCHRMYGSTEAPAITRGWMGEGEAELAASTDGKILGWEASTLDAEGRHLPDGAEGEIVARGPALMVGYSDPAATEASFTPDGWFLTGDIGYITPERAIVITGRKKDLIIRGGENISAKEIEDVLHTHPGIQEASVVAMPHPRLGEGVCAYLIARPGVAAPTPAEIAEFVASAGLARQKLPERVVFIEEFPRTPSGKIRKDILRQTIKDTLDAEKGAAAKGPPEKNA